MTDFDRQSLLLIGVCGPPHGVKGEVKVIPETDDPERLLDMQRVWMGASPETAVERVVERSRLQTAKRGLVVLMHFEGVADRDAAETFRRSRVYARIDDLPALGEGQHFLHDMLGLEVFSETDHGPERVGVIADVIEGVAQDLLVVRREALPDVMVPDVDEIVIAVDIEARTITIRPPEGLLD